MWWDGDIIIEAQQSGIETVGDRNVGNARLVLWSDQSDQMLLALAFAQHK